MTTNNDALASRMFCANHHNPFEHMITDDLYLKVTDRSATVFNPNLAGKRGKRVVTVIVALPNAQMSSSDERMAFCKRVLFCDTLESVEDVARNLRLAVNVRIERGIDVVSPFEGELTITNESMFFRISTTSYMIRDLRDLYNEPTVISTGSKTKIKKFYAKVRAMQATVEKMSYSEVSTLAYESDTKAHSYCAVD